MMTRDERELARRLKGSSQMQRVRAAREMLETWRGTDELKLAAFLYIFRPDKPEKNERAVRWAREQ